MCSRRRRRGVADEGNAVLADDVGEEGLQVRRESRDKFTSVALSQRQNTKVSHDNWRSEPETSEQIQSRTGAEIRTKSEARTLDTSRYAVNWG